MDINEREPEKIAYTKRKRVCQREENYVTEGKKNANIMDCMDDNFYCSRILFFR